MDGQVFTYFVRNVDFSLFQIFCYSFCYRNLQDAICSYLEYSPDSSVPLPKVEIVAEGELVAQHGEWKDSLSSVLFLPPNSSGTKCWRVTNSGINK